MHTQTVKTVSEDFNFKEIEEEAQSVRKSLKLDLD
jgi:hypothetical protein